MFMDCQSRMQPLGLGVPVASLGPRAFSAAILLFASGCGWSKVMLASVLAHALLLAQARHKGTVLMHRCSWSLSSICDDNLRTQLIGA